MKRSFALLLAFVLCLSYLPAVQAAQRRMGDVTNDGEITAVDAMEILKQSVRSIYLSEADYPYADVDGNGYPLATDALLVLQFSVDIIQYFPAEKATVAIQKAPAYWDLKDTLPSRFGYIKVIETYEQFQGFCSLALLTEESDLSQFTPSFFEDHSLLTIAARSSSRDKRIRVEEIYALRNTLYVQLVDSHSCVIDHTPDRLHYTVIEKVTAPYNALQLDVYNLHMSSSRDNPEDWDVVNCPVVEPGECKVFDGPADSSNTDVLIETLAEYEALQARSEHITLPPAYEGLFDEYALFHFDQQWPYPGYDFTVTGYKVKNSTLQIQATAYFDDTKAHPCVCESKRYEYWLKAEEVEKVTQVELKIRNQRLTGKGLQEETKVLTFSN